MREQAIIGCAAFFLISVLTCDAQQDDRLPIDLQPFRWQLLPQAVQALCVGPDGRSWYRVAPGESKSSEAEIRPVLEKEYHERSPQVTRASLALLEPGGRAWFYVKPDELWGYDGEKWIERKAATGSIFTGYCPTRGQLLNNLANRVARGRAWFRDEQGIHVYDGKDWSYSTLCPPINSERHLPRFAVSPNGKFAVAMTPRFAGRSPDLTDADLWFWHEANQVWEKRTIVWGDGKSTFGTFCVTDEGKLWCIQNGVLRILNLAATKDVTDRLPQLIAQLDDDNAQTRQRASEALDEVAEQIQPQLRAAQRSAESAEMKRRLDALVQRVGSFKAQPVIAQGHGTAVGSLVVHTAASVYEGEQGKRFVFGIVSSRANQPSHNALVVVDQAGNANSISLDVSFNTGSVTPAESRTPILTHSGAALWVSGNVFTGGLARRLDLTSREIVPQNSDTIYALVHAVDSSGRVFLNPSYFNLEPTYSVGVFSPEIPDTRPLLHAEAYPVENTECVVDSDGKAWAARKEGVSRFDGRTWELIHPINRGYAYPTLAGREGLVLCRSTGEFVLFNDNKPVAIAPLRKLIAAYPNTFAAAFPPSFTPVQRNYRVWIATDVQRNIWLLENNVLSVFTGARWIETPRGIDTVPALRNGEGARVLLAVGGGRKVFFSTALAEIQDGKMVVTEAPQCTLDIQMPIGFRDREGAFWLPCYTPAQTVRNVPRREHQTIRLGENGPLQELAKNAWPFLVDDSDNVWLAEMGQARPRGHFWIWRDGNIVQEIQIPGAQDMRTIFTNKPGSIFVGTSLGLHHLIADDRERGGQIRLQQTYALPPSTVMPNQFTCTYGERAGLVIATKAKELTFAMVPTD